MSQQLLSPVTLGAFSLKNRVIMAPMTRARCSNRVPDQSTATYYSQRAGAGLLITEATQISSQGIGSVFTPGIHTAEQIAGWKSVTDAVHAAGGKILCQIWHVGRVSHSSMQDDQAAPVSSSAVRAEAHTFTLEGYEPTSEPRALATEEVQDVVNDYRQAAINAIEAGFDGVQIHGANGYLIDQFLRDGVNKREDQYGGSVENRCRFLLEVTDAVADAIGADRTTVRLSPFTNTYDCIDSEPSALFLHAAKELSSRNLAFVEIVERGLDPATTENTQEDFGYTPADFRKTYQGNLVINGQYLQANGEQALQEKNGEAISIGRPFISTPDLVERFASGAALNEDTGVEFWYGGDDNGYIDQTVLG